MCMNCSQYFITGGHIYVFIRKYLWRQKQVCAAGLSSSRVSAEFSSESLFHLRSDGTKHSELWARAEPSAAKLCFLLPFQSNKVIWRRKKHSPVWGFKQTRSSPQADKRNWTVCLYVITCYRGVRPFSLCTRFRVSLVHDGFHRSPTT